MNWLQKLKLLLQLKGCLKKLGEIKVDKGIKTSEFWISIFTVIVSLWFGLQGIIPAELSIKILALVALIYTLVRAIVKFTPTTKDDELLAKLEQIVADKKK